MNIEVWLTFVLASFVLCFTPGPTVFLVVAQSISQDRASSVPLVLGVALGDVVAMCVSFAGLGALLMTSAFLFGVFKWVAAGYLIYLGVKAWRSQVSQIETDVSARSRLSMFKDAFLVTALNPKGIIFFIAFFPHFISEESAFGAQVTIMGGTFVVVSIISASVYSYFSGQLRRKVHSLKFQRVFNQTSGGLLVGAGTLTATMQKAG